MRLDMLAAWAGRHRTIAIFLTLSGFAGVTIGMLMVLSTLFAIRLGATPLQMGVIRAAESLSMALMTLPAGVMIGRYGARRIYILASLGAMSVYTLAPFAQDWLALTIIVALGGLCIPFRIVSMTGSFMEQLKTIGISKAGWYRGSQVVGMIAVGPFLGVLALNHFGLLVSYWSIAAMFGLMAIAGFGILSNQARADAPRTLGGDLKAFGDLLRNPEVAGVCAVEFSSSVVFAFFSAFIILMAVTMLHMSEPLAVSIRFFEGFISVSTLFFGGVALRHWSTPQLYRAALVLIVAGLILMGVALDYWLLVLATTALGIGLGITNIVNVQQLSGLAVEKSKLASLQLLCSMSGNCAGGLVGGALSTVLGLRGLFFFGAVLYTVLALRWCFPSAAPAVEPSERPS